MGKYKLNNWIPGADIEIDQLIKTENFFTEKLIDSLATRMSDTNYGLLPLRGNRNESCKLELEVQNNRSVRLNLIYCLGVTLTGCRIHYDSGYNQPVFTTLDFDSQNTNEEELPAHWHIVLTVDPFQRIPLAYSDKGSKLPADYFVDYFYSLSVIPEDTFYKTQENAHTLIIGRILRNEKEYTLDSQYIPPCQQMESHLELIRYNNLFERQLNELENISFTIIDKIHLKKRYSSIENSVFALCKAIVLYNAKIHSFYKNTGSYSTPLENITYFMTLANVIKMDLAKLATTDKEELLKYFREWNDINPGAFEEMLKEICELKYDHKNIRPAMVQVESFLNLITDLWLTLSKLHYIGQYNESMIISERVVDDYKPKSKGGWVIMD